MRAVHGGIIGRGNCLINVVQVAGVYRDAETGQYCPLLSPDIKCPFFFIETCVATSVIDVVV